MARGFKGCRIVQQPFADPAAFESWACQQARHSWILRVLPTERVNTDLAREVQLVSAAEPAEDAFLIPRSLYFRGRPLNHGGVRRKSSVRLFRKDAVRFECRNGEVEIVPRSERVGRIRFPLSYEMCSDICLHFDEMIRAAKETAGRAHAQGKRPSLWLALMQAPWQLFESYFLKGGWLDGWAGLHASVLAAFGVYLRETMLWECEQPAAASPESAEAQKFKVFPGPTEAFASADAEASIGPVEERLRELDRRRMRPAA